VWGVSVWVSEIMHIRVFVAFVVILCNCRMIDVCWCIAAAAVDRYFVSLESVMGRNSPLV
jgi:hypothetical protein